MSTQATTLPASASAPARRRRAGATLIAGGALVGVLLLTAAVGVVWTPADPGSVDLAQRLAPPGTEGHLLGTDNFGRDIASQIMAGARNSLTVALFGAGLALVIGVAAGGCAAVLGGWADEAIARGSDIVFAFPAVLLALLISVKLGAGNLPAVIAIAVAQMPIFTRITRGSAKRILARDFVLAARGYGRSRRYVFARHVLPNILDALIVQTAIAFALAIVVEAALAFLGLGVQPPDASWGRMLKDAQPFLESQPLLSVWPGLAIVLSVLGFNLLGDGLRDALDPRLEERSR